MVFCTRAAEPFIGENTFELYCFLVKIIVRGALVSPRRRACVFAKVGMLSSPGKTLICRTVPFVVVTCFRIQNMLFL